jgi:preprotein translocase subunit SecG
MFREYSEKGESLVGNSQKTFVQFTNENEIENSDIKKTNSGNLLTLPNVKHKKSGSDISEYHEADEEKGKEARTLIKRGLTHITIILSAILLVICLLLSGCGGKSTFDGSRTSDETVCCLYHQRKEFISVPYEPKDASHLKQC